MRESPVVRRGQFSRHAIGDAAHLVGIVRHHQHRHLALQRHAASRRAIARRLRRAAGRLVENQQLGQRIERVGEQHAPQLAARQHRQRPVLESAQAHAIEEQRDPLARRARDAEADRALLSRQREKIGDGHRQRAIDVKLLRDVRNAAAARPVRDDAPVERHEPENRRQQRRLARAVRSDEGVQRAALDA